MSSRNREVKCETFDVDDLKGIRINTKNYRVSVVKGEGDKIIVHYVNNDFRSMVIKRRGKGLYMEEKMAVTFYELSDLWSWWRITNS